MTSTALSPYCCAASFACATVVERGRIASTLVEGRATEPPPSLHGCPNFSLDLFELTGELVYQHRLRVLPEKIVDVVLLHIRNVVLRDSKKVITSIFSLAAVWDGLELGRMRVASGIHTGRHETPRGN